MLQGPRVVAARRPRMTCVGAYRGREAPCESQPIAPPSPCPAGRTWPSAGRLRRCSWAGRWRPASCCRSGARPLPLPAVALTLPRPWPLPWLRPLPLPWPARSGPGRGPDRRGPDPVPGAGPGAAAAGARGGGAKARRGRAPPAAPRCPSAIPPPAPSCGSASRCRAGMRAPRCCRTRSRCPAAPARAVRPMRWT